MSNNPDEGGGVGGAPNIEKPAGPYVWPHKHLLDRGPQSIYMCLVRKYDTRNATQRVYTHGQAKPRIPEDSYCSYVSILELQLRGREAHFWHGRGKGVSQRPATCRALPIFGPLRARKIQQ